MTWAEEHNDMLIREMYLFEPWKYKKGSKERGEMWEKISDSLNCLDKPTFNVTQKSVRDHYNLLEKQQKRRLREEEKASGISPEPTELESALEDIMELFSNRDEEEKLKEVDSKENAEAEASKALEIRQLAMETLAESKKRKCETKDGGKPKRKVSSNGTDTIAYLKMRSELDAELKREEIRIKQAEAEDRKAQQNSMILQQEALTKALTNSITSQQKQQEQFMQQMQIQNAALIALLQNITNKD